MLEYRTYGIFSFWAATSGNVPSDLCARRWFRSACAFAYSDQSLDWAHFRWPRMRSFFMRTTKTLIRLRGCAVWLESLLGAHARRYIFSYCGSFRKYQWPSVRFSAVRLRIIIRYFLNWYPQKTIKTIIRLFAQQHNNKQKVSVY